MNERKSGAVAMAATEGERLAALEAAYKAHEKSDDERYQRIENNTQQTMNMIADLGRKLDGGFTRVHSRIDEEAKTARDHTDEAHDRIGRHKIWILSTAITVLLSVLVYVVTTWGPLAKAAE